MVSASSPVVFTPASFAAVVVAYHPDRAALARLVATLKLAVGVVWIVDNSQPGVLSDKDPTWLPARVLSPGANLGVAGAYNLAVQRTTEVFPEVQALFLFDQDSEPDLNCIETLKARLLELLQRGERVVQVGPVYYEKQRNFFPPLILADGWRMTRTPVTHAAACTRVSYMISSGSLIYLPALAQVGSFDERLFIDYVDVEFGLRAQHAGYSSWIAGDARMDHAIGESPLVLGPWTLPSHSSLRRHYQARNALLLMTRPEIAIVWKLHELARFPVRFAFMMLARNGLPGQLTGWFRGIRDGLSGKTGCIRQPTSQR
jgi:rhamnosyltransferase